MGEKETEGARTSPKSMATDDWESGRKGGGASVGKPNPGHIEDEGTEARINNTKSNIGNRTAGGNEDWTDDDTDDDGSPESAINNSHSNIKGLRSAGGGGGNEDWADDDTDDDARHQALVNNETIDPEEARLNGLPPGTPQARSHTSFDKTDPNRTGPIRIDSTPARVVVQGIQDGDTANELAIGDQGAVEEHPKKPL